VALGTQLLDPSYQIGGLTWDAFAFIMKTAHAYRGNGETSKKIPGQHRERVVSATNS